VSSRPQISVASCIRSVGPTRPEFQVASSSSYRSETAFHNAIDSVMSLVAAAPLGEDSAARSSSSSSRCRSSRHRPRASMYAAA
jgi:hypothetical protein